ncbi:MAG: MupG family TIM beta-alpha barrel fold protein [Solobacterium sp.]|nr:MupG family TIM beta-alpha barrel fold protein [Solobacterium sp.]
MKPVLGVSVYPDLRPLSEIREYLKLASSYGFTRVFSSMFTVQGTKEEVLQYFTELDACAHEFGMQVSLDVNPECFRRIGASADDLSVFHEIGCDIVRMDMSFPVEEDVKLLKNPYGLKIEYNASMKTAEDVQKMLDLGADPERMLFCHNFYPQRYTGYRWDKFLAVNRGLASCNVRVAAFVSSNAPDTHGVWGAHHGLPTVEKLRGLPIDLQTRIILATKDVTDILIGNAYASEEEFQAMQAVLEKKTADQDNPLINFIRTMAGGLDFDTLPQHKMKVVFDPEATATERSVVLEFFPHSDVGDSSEWMWRSRGPRFIYRQKSIPARTCEKEYFEHGDIVMVNDNYKSYTGEVQIVRLPMENDGERNLVGHLAKGEEILLDLIPDGEIVVFEEY